MKIRIDGTDTIYYDFPELEKLLGISKKTLYSWKQKGKIKVYQVGKKYFVSSADLKAFMESNPVSGT